MWTILNKLKLNYFFSKDFNWICFTFSKDLLLYMLFKLFFYIMFIIGRIINNNNMG